MCTLSNGFHEILALALRTVFMYLNGNMVPPFLSLFLSLFPLSFYCGRIYVYTVLFVCFFCALTTSVLIVLLAISLPFLFSFIFHFLCLVVASGYRLLFCIFFLTGRARRSTYKNFCTERKKRKKEGKQSRYDYDPILVLRVCLSKQHSRGTSFLYILPV